MKLKAGGMPPTELPPLPDSRAAFRARFWRGLAKAYAIALTVAILAIAYFS
jgi:hypothetical protein